MKPKKTDTSLSEKRNLREIERRRSNREAILHAAESVICRKGLSATSMDDVAAEAGFSKATLYKYIRGKTELVFELLIHFVEDLDDRLRLIGERPLKPEAKVQAFFREVILHQADKENISRAFLADRSLFRLIHVMAGAEENPATAPERAFIRRLLEARQAVNSRVEAFLQEGIAAGVFRPMHLESGMRFLGAVIQGYQHDKFFREAKPDLEKDVSDIYTFVLHGISSGK